MKLIVSDFNTKIGKEDVGRITKDKHFSMEEKKKRDHKHDVSTK